MSVASCIRRMYGFAYTAGAVCQQDRVRRGRRCFLPRLVQRQRGRGQRVSLGVPASSAGGEAEECGWGRLRARAAWEDERSVSDRSCALLSQSRGPPCARRSLWPRGAWRGRGLPETPPDKTTGGQESGLRRCGLFEPSGIKGILPEQLIEIGPVFPRECCSA
jgi:hypothetical protein